MPPKSLFALALSATCACANTGAIPRAPVAATARAEPRRAVAPSPTVARAAPAAPTFDPSALAFRTAVEGWVQRAGARAHRSLSLSQLSDARATSWEPGTYAFDATVRDDGNGERVAFRGFARRRSYRGAPWLAREDFFERSVAECFALRGAGEWLSAHPEVLRCARVSLEALTFVWSLTTADVTTMCAESTPAHGLPIRGCWLEPGAPAEILPGAFDYGVGGRDALFGRFATAASRVVRVRIDEPGRVSRASSARGALRVVPSPSEPDLGPLTELIVREEPGSEAGVTTLRLSTETESRRCVRRARWTCEPVQSGITR
jgi:hypothetical protein